MIYNFYQLQANVINWAKDRNLIKGSDPKQQFHKLIQECAELSESICKGKDASDDVGDVTVVLLIMCEQLGLDFEACLAKAYDDIKDRKGVMRDGIFIKDE